MALTFVQRKDANGAGTTQTVAFTSSVTSGDLIVLEITILDTGGTVSSISDTRGNTYTARATASGNDGINLKLFTYDCTSVGTGANTISVTVSSSNGFIELTTWQFHSSVAGTWTFDKGAFTSGTAATALSGTTAATTQANEVMVSYMGLFGTAGTYLAGWTGTNDGSGNASAYKIVSSTGTQNCSITQGSSNRYIGSIATYYCLASGTTQNATASIASGSGTVATAQNQAKATDTLAALASLVNTAKVQAKATDTLAAHASLVNTAKVIHSATDTLAPSVSTTAIAAVTHKAQDTLAAVASLVNTAKVLHNAIASIASSSSLVETPLGTHRAVASIAPGAALVNSAAVIHNATDTLAAIASLVNTASAIRNTSDSIATHVSLVATASAGKNATASIASGAALTALQLILRRTSTSIATASNIMMADQAMMHATLTIAGIASLINTAKAIHSGSTSIAALAATVNTARVMSHNSTTTNAGATLGVTANVVCKATALIQPSSLTTLIISQYQQFTASIASGSSIYALPSVSQFFNYVDVDPEIAAGATFSKCAAFVIHNASVQIFAGRPLHPSASIQTRATLSAIANKVISSASVSIVGGLSPQALTATRIFVLTRVSSTPRVVQHATCGIISHAGISPTATQATISATILAHLVVAPVPRVRYAMAAQVQTQSSILATPTLSTSSLPLCFLFTGAHLLATPRVLRASIVAIATRASSLDTGSAKYGNIHATIATRISMLANDSVRQAPVIDVINTRSTVAAPPHILSRTQTSIASGATLGLVATQLQKAVVSIVASGSPQVMASFQLHGQANLTPTAILTPNAKVPRSSANILQAGSTVGANSRVLHPVALAIHAGITMLATGHNVTTAPATTFNVGASMSLSAKVVHTGALTIQSGAAVGDVSRINRNATVNVQTHAAPACGARALYNSISSMSTGSHMLLGVGQHIAVSASNVGSGAAMIAHVTVVQGGQVNIVSGLSASPPSRVTAHAILSILSGSTVAALGRRAVNLQATIASATATHAAGIDPFFGGAQTSVTSQQPSGAVTQVPPATVTQLS